MILTFARPSVGAQVGAGNVVNFGFLPQGSPPAASTGFQNPITTATHPRLIRFGFPVYGTAGQVAVQTTSQAMGGLGYPVLPEKKREEIREILREIRQDEIDKAELLDAAAEREIAEIEEIMFLMDALQ